MLLAIGTHFGRTPFDNYTWMADAWLHGNAYLTHLPGQAIDAIPYHGRAQLVEAPLPGVLMIPFVLFWGTNANQVILSCILGAVGAGATWLLCERLKTTLWQRIALVAFFVFGTSYFWCAVSGGVWYLAHVSTVAFTMLALAELAGKRRGWLVALFACCAGLSRFPLFVALPFYFALIPAGATNRWDGRRAFLAVAAASFAAWIWDNEARWGTWNDIGLTLLYHQSIEQFDHIGSPFSLLNFPKQFHAFFFSQPDWSSTWPWLQLGNFGNSIQWMSPALVVAFWAKQPVKTVIGLWTLVVLAAIPQFVYFSPGDTQLGMRHALDFEPFLFVLMIYAMRERKGVFLWPLYAYSVVVGIYGIWYWHYMGR